MRRERERVRAIASAGPRVPSHVHALAALRGTAPPIERARARARALERARACARKGLNGTQDKCTTIIPFSCSGRFLKRDCGNMLYAGIFIALTVLWIYTVSLPKYSNLCGNCFLNNTQHVVVIMNRVTTTPPQIVIIML